VKKALASAWLGAVVANTALGNAALATPAVDLFCTRERTMYDELQRRASELARDAAAAHAGTFWSARSDGAGDVGGDVSDAAPGELDAALLRGDARVREAFEELKRRDAMVLRAGDALRIVQQAVVRGNRIVLEDHLALPAIPGAARYGARYGARYCRNVDLVTIARLAPQFDQVPDLFAAYNRAAPPAPLPDFLGALSALIGLGFLSFA
jgi:hypothetical protein